MDLFHVLRGSSTEFALTITSRLLCLRSFTHSCICCHESLLRGFWCNLLSPFTDSCRNGLKENGTQRQKWTHNNRIVVTSLRLWAGCTRTRRELHTMRTKVSIFPQFLSLLFQCSTHTHYPEVLNVRRETVTPTGFFLQGEAHRHQLYRWNLSLWCSVWSKDHLPLIQYDSEPELSLPAVDHSQYKNSLIENLCAETY